MSDWPDGKPQATEALPDGRARHTMADGRVLTIPGAATHRLEYLSTWVGAGATYAVSITLIGASHVDGFYEAWNYDIGEVRHYRFDKTVRLVDVRTGTEHSSDEIREAISEKRSQSQQAEPEAHHVRFVAIVDTETTGLAEYDEPISVGLVLVEVDMRGALVRECDRYYGMREPSVPIHPAAQRVHGITIDLVRGKQLDVERVASILSRAEVAIAHNAMFDARMLAKVIDHQLVWRCSLDQFPWVARAGKKLDHVCQSLGVHRAEPHNALTDAEALLACLLQRTGKTERSRTYLGALVAQEAIAIAYRPRNAPTSTFRPTASAPVAPIVVRPPALALARQRRSAVSNVSPSWSYRLGRFLARLFS